MFCFVLFGLTVGTYFFHRDYNRILRLYVIRRYLHKFRANLGNRHVVTLWEQIRPLS